MKFFVQKPGRKVKGGGRISPHYYASAQANQPAPVKRQRSSVKTRVKRWLVLIFVAAAIVIIFSMDTHPQVSVDSQLYRSANTYKQGVVAAFDGIRNRSKVTLNKDAIQRAIQQRFPEVDQVKIITPIYSRNARVELKIAPPEFTLSGGPGTFGENVQYIIANNGKLIGLRRDFPQIKELPNLTDQVGSQIKTGEVVLGQGTASFILAIIAQCQKSNVPVASFNLAANSQEIDLKTKDKAYYVKFSLAGDPATQIGQFLAARDQLAKSGEPSQYLDVRVDGRIFYK